MRGGNTPPKKTKKTKKKIILVHRYTPHRGPQDSLTMHIALGATEGAFLDLLCQNVVHARRVALVTYSTVLYPNRCDERTRSHCEASIFSSLCCVHARQLCQERLGLRP